VSSHSHRRSRTATVRYRRHSPAQRTHRLTHRTERRTLCIATLCREGPVKRAHGARNGSFTHASRHQSHSRQGAGWRSAIICFVAGAIAHICFPSPKICFVAGAIAHICFVSAIICFVAGAIAHICFPSPKICFVAGAIAHICFVSAIICFVAGAVANICFVAAIICFVAGAITTNSFAWPALWLTADLIC
jgi:hypothetical protein